MFLGKALTPIFGSTWHGIPHSKHSKTIGEGVPPFSFFELPDVPALLFRFVLLFTLLFVEVAEALLV